MKEISICSLRLVSSLNYLSRSLFKALVLKTESSCLRAHTENYDFAIPTNLTKVLAIDGKCYMQF